MFVLSFSICTLIFGSITAASAGPKLTRTLVSNFVVGAVMHEISSL